MDAMSDMREMDARDGEMTNVIRRSATSGQSSEYPASRTFDQSRIYLYQTGVFSRDKGDPYSTNPRPGLKQNAAG